MKIGLLLHLYQPITQEVSLLKDISTKCYSPLVKILKNNKNIKLSLNIPLCLLQQLDAGLVHDLKELYDAERIELTGSGAYHPILTKIPSFFVEKQVILNEYGLGYYFGRYKNFDGDPSVVLKDVIGFFPPELGVSLDLIKQIESFGYKWLLVDEKALPESSYEQNNVCGFNLSGHDIKIVKRNSSISNILAFKRDAQLTDILTHINLCQDQGNDVLIIALDGETFGYHNKEGITLFENLYDALSNLGIRITTITDAITTLNSVELDPSGIRESTWSSINDDIYPMWCDYDNKIHGLQWEILDNLCKHYMSKYAGSTLSPVDGYEHLPIWNAKTLETIENINLRKDIELDVLINQALHSDQFWWASKRQLGTGEILYNKSMVLKGLALFEKVAKELDISDNVISEIAEIKNLLE